MTDTPLATLYQSLDQHRPATLEALLAGVAPPVNLQATHAKALEVVTLEMLQQAG